MIATPNHPFMMTAKEIAEIRYRGMVSERTISRLVQQKKIGSYRLSPRKIMIPLSEIERYESEQMEASKKDIHIIK